MKKDVLSVVIFILVVFLVTFIFLKGDDIAKVLIDKSNEYVEELKNKKEVSKRQREGYTVLKDGSLWYTLSKTDDTITLLSAYPVSGNKKIEDDPYYIAYSKNGDALNSTDLFDFLGRGFTKTIFDNLNDKEATLWIPSVADLEKLGCDVEKLSCEDSKIKVNYPFWTNTLIENKVYVLDKDKKLKPYEATDKAAVHVIIKTDIKNIY